MRGLVSRDSLCTTGQTTSDTERETRTERECSERWGIADRGAAREGVCRERSRRVWVPFFGERLVPASASKYCYLDGAHGLRAHHVLQNTMHSDAVQARGACNSEGARSRRNNTVFVTARARKVSLSRTVSRGAYRRLETLSVFRFLVFIRCLLGTAVQGCVAQLCTFSLPGSVPRPLSAGASGLGRSFEDQPRNERERARARRVSTNRNHATT